MAAKVYEIIDVQLLAGQTILNVFHYVDETGLLEEDDLVEDFISGYIADVVNNQTEDCSHVAVRHRLVYPTAELTHERAISPAVPGLLTDTPLASCDAASVKWEIGTTVVLAGGFAGHIKRGGMRLGGLTEADVVGNLCGSSIIANWTDPIFPALSLPGSTSFMLCVASFLDGARARQTTVQSYALVTGSSDPAPSTQNTRKVLRGRTS